MRTFAILIVGLIAQGAAALLTEAQYPFRAPRRGDLRSPCPGINTAANHGILPRSGRDIDIPTLQKAILLAFNMTYETTLVIGIPSLSTSTTGNASTFHLSDLKQHMPQAVDHDGSLSRQDAYFGNNEKFDKKTWRRALKNWGNIEILTFEAAAKEIKARFEYGKKHNPTFNATFAREPALLQYGLLLSQFGHYITGNSNLTLVKYFMENERLPLQFGWQPSPNAIILPNNRLLAGNVSAIWDRLDKE